MPGPEIPGESDRWRVEEELRRALECAREEYKKASRDFDAHVLEPPGALPAADGHFRAEQIRRRYGQAFEQYRQALKEFTDFVLGKGPRLPLG